MLFPTARVRTRPATPQEDAMLETKRFLTMTLLALLTVALAAGCAKRSTQAAGSSPTGQQGAVIPQETNVPEAKQVLPQYVPEKTWTYQDMPTPAPSGTPQTRIDGVTFDPGSIQLTREGRAVGLVIFNWMKENAARDVLIIGFATASEGTGDAAMGLGRKRAEAARDYIVSLGGDKSRLQVASYGSQFSKAGPTEPDLQKIERRVDFWSVAH
jgi:outer membrane protein OmpA-like peptidoglycan-associated protein